MFFESLKSIKLSISSMPNGTMAKCKNESYHLPIHLQSIANRFEDQRSRRVFCPVVFYRPTGFSGFMSPDLSALNAGLWRKVMTGVGDTVRPPWLRADGPLLWGIFAFYLTGTQGQTGNRARVSSCSYYPAVSFDTFTTLDPPSHMTSVLYVGFSPPNTLQVCREHAVCGAGHLCVPRGLALGAAARPGARHTG